MYRIETSLPLVDEILITYKNLIGEAYPGYRNHVYRVVNLCFSTSQFSAIEKEKIQIAGCFHDIGIWTNNTLDYLAPSTWCAEEYLAQKEHIEWTDEITEIINMHHRLSRCTESQYPLVEFFRKSDIADFSLGVVSMGLPRELISALKSEFPNNGFHLFLLKSAFSWLLKHPLNPAPMFRR